MAGPVFQYTSLYVKISEGKKLPSREVSSYRNPFCVLKVDNEAVARTATVYRSLEPFWGEEYTLHVPNEFQAVAVHVFDYDLMGSKEPLGKVMLDRESILSSPRGLDRWFPLTAATKHDEVQGEVLMEIVLTDHGTGGDHIKALVTVVEARDLAAKGDGKCDPFATLYYNEEQFSTPVIAKTRFPRWKKSFDISIPRPMTTTQHRTLKVTIYNWDKFTHNHFMGQIEIDLSELQNDQRYKTWYRLQHSDQKGKDKKKELGSLRLKVQCHEERILDAQFYTPFVEFMLNAVDEKKPEGCAVLSALEEVMTMDRNSVAHSLVRFYLANGSVLPLLDVLTLREINNTTVPATLFRGNSLASKAVDQFMKIVALPYLHNTISPVIHAIYTEKKLCELDSEQLRQNNKSSAGKAVEASVGILAEYAKQLMESVFSSVDQCPALLRMALRQLWARVAERFTGPEHTNVPFLAVSGFLFLRFFVPAVLSPKLFALRDEHPDQRTERTLKLLAKVMQNISNLQEEMEAKEPFMHPMNFIMPDSVARVKAFILNLVQIDQKEVSAERGVRDGGYIHHLILCKGFLWKRSTSTAVGGSLQYRKRYFELSNIALTYSQNEKKLAGDVKSYPVQWIKVTEKMDEGAYHRKHMFQVVIVPTPGMPNAPPQTTLHLQASDVNEQNRWVSAIRKACLTNRDMIPVYHPGAFKNGKWTCCRTPASQEPGCSHCHRGITMGDWRDPLDPDLDAQILFSQFMKGRQQMIKKYLPDDGSVSTSTRGSSSSSPTPSSGAASLGHEEEGGGATAGENFCEKQCRDLLALVDELKWYHEQCSSTT